MMNDYKKPIIWAVKAYTNKAVFIRMAIQVLEEVAVLHTRRYKRKSLLETLGVDADKRKNIIVA